MTILSLETTMSMEETQMIDKKIIEGNLTPETYKDFILKLERENLQNLVKEDKKSIVAKIIRIYEEAKKNGNS